MTGERGLRREAAGVAVRRRGAGSRPRAAVKSRTNADGPGGCGGRAFRGAGRRGTPSRPAESRSPPARAWRTASSIAWVRPAVAARSSAQVRVGDGATGPGRQSGEPLVALAPDALGGPRHARELPHAFVRERQVQRQSLALRDVARCRACRTSRRSPASRRSAGPFPSGSGARRAGSAASRSRTRNESSAVVGKGARGTSTGEGPPRLADEAAQRPLGLDLGLEEPLPRDAERLGDRDRIVAARLGATSRGTGRGERRDKGRHSDGPRSSLGVTMPAGPTGRNASGTDACSGDRERSAGGDRPRERLREQCLRRPRRSGPSGARGSPATGSAGSRPSGARRRRR